MGFKNPLHGPASHQRRITVVDRNAAQSIPNLADTLISFDLLEQDEQGFWDPAFPTQLSVPGRTEYIIEAQVRFAANAAGYRYVAIFMGGFEWKPTRLPATPTDTFLQLVRANVRRTTNSGTIIGIGVNQSSGAALDVTFARLTVISIGRA